jgi:uncharacterized protein YbjT (DUF2867 family)
VTRAEWAKYSRERSPGIQCAAEYDYHGEYGEGGIRMIRVVGASGALGREGSRQSLAAGRRVGRLVRRRDQAANLQHQGIEIVQGDLIDPASCARVCQRINAVLASARALMGARTHSSEAADDAGHRALIDAARSTGVKHFIYTSELSPYKSALTPRIRSRPP